MENYIGLAAVVAAFCFSKGDRSVPTVIISYYIAFITADFLFWGMQDSIFTPVSTNVGVEAQFQLTLVAISTITVITLLSVCKRNNLVKVYAAIVVLSSVHNTLSLFAGALQTDWYDEIYLFHQRYAIQLDIAFAWWASDNAISQKLNEALKWRKEDKT